MSQAAEAVVTAGHRLSKKASEGKTGTTRRLSTFAKKTVTGSARRLSTTLALNGLMRGRRPDHPSKPCYILLPNSKIAVLRDLAVTLVLPVVFTLVPFEVSFVDLPPEPNASHPLWIINRVIDGVFVVDLVLNFLVAVPKVSTDVDDFQKVQGDKDIDEDKRFEFRLSRIALSYLFGWLLLDIVSLAPSIVDVWIVLDLHFSTISDQSSASGTPNGIDDLRAARVAKVARIAKIARVVRMLRLLKLFRVLKALTEKRKGDRTGGLGELVQGTLNLLMAEHSRKLRIGVLLLRMYCISHLLACLLGLTAITANHKIDTWWGTHGYCWPDEDQPPWESPEDWISGEGVVGDDLTPACVGAFLQYFVCLHFVFGAVFKLPVAPFLVTGPAPPHFTYAPNRRLFQEGEHFLFVLVGILASMMGMYLTGTFVSVVSNAKPTVAETVSIFAHRYKLDSDVRRRLHRYFVQLAGAMDTIPHESLFERLSPELRLDILLEMHRSWLGNVPFAPHALGEVDDVDDAYGGDEDNGRASAVRRSSHKRLLRRETGKKLLAFMARNMEAGVFVANERPPTGRFFVIVMGVAVDDVRHVLLKDSQNWGAYEAIISAQRHAITTVRAYTFLQVVSISRESLASLPEKEPDLKGAFTRVRVWALRSRLLFGAVRVANAYKAASLVGLPKTSPPGSQSPSTPGTPGQIASPVSTRRPSGLSILSMSSLRDVAMSAAGAVAFAPAEEVRVELREREAVSEGRDNRGNGGNGERGV